MSTLTRPLRRLAVATLAASLAACQTTAPRDNMAGSAIASALQADTPAKPAPPPPAAVRDALLPPVSVGVPGAGRPVEQHFDVAVNHMPARRFFMGLVDGTPYNMVVHPDVKGDITLNLKNVTLEQVMRTVRDVYGYEYRHEGKLYEVLPARMRSRIFQVNYLDIRRMGSSETRVSAGQVSSSGGGGQPTNGTTGTTTSSTSGTSSSNTQGSDDGSQTVLGSDVRTESDSDFWKGLQTSLDMLVGKGGGRSVVVNAQAGIVVVRAMPGELRDVADFLKETQASVQRQVILEAKIIEVQLNHGFQSGINWAALGQPGSGKSILFGQTGGGTLLGANGTSPIAGNTGDLNPGNYNPLIGTATSAFGGMFTLSLNLNDFNAFIELLKTQGNVQVLSSPRVATVNNQKAVIKVGTDEFFVTNVTTNTNTTTVSGLNQTVNVQLTPFFSGVALDVVPQIDDHGDVILHVHPTVSDVTEKTKQINVSTTTSLSVPLALSSIRESDTIIRAHSGQVVVIGGLMKNTVSDTVASTPVLGDLPVVGNLFRHTKQVNNKSELVILLRPLVVGSNSSWSDTLQETAARLRAMRHPQDGGAMSGDNP